MPEVVEVYLTSKFIESTILGKNVTDIIVSGGRYLKKEITGLENFKKLLPMKVNSVGSKGKFIYIDFGNISLASTLGLAGSWGYIKSKYSDVSFKLGDGTILYYTDPMKYGTLSFISTEDRNKKLNSLEDDVLLTKFTDMDFIKKLKEFKNKDKNIVTVLMEQKIGQALFSGIGNYLSVEILYHSNIDPHSTITDY